MEKQREEWQSKIGFIFAAAGSAIGLGNIWRFPYMTGLNGGAAFVLIYLIFAVTIGLALMLAELTLGRRSRKNAYGAFTTVIPGTRWRWVGALGIFTGLAILSFYSVVAGWTVGYIFKTVSGQFVGLTGSDQLKAIFLDLVGNPWTAIGLHGLFIALTILVVLGGIAKGIERWSRVLMPVLFALLILLAIRSLTLGPGVEKGLKFYLKPDFSKVGIETLITALGQALFSLSLGMGAMITYGSYVSKSDNLVTSATTVVFFDTLIALLAGLVIFPALFYIGLEPQGGAGLVFMVLPLIFDKIPGGLIFGTGFFLLLSVAALTSTISLLEVPVSYLIDEKKWSRKLAAIGTGVVAFLMGIPSAISQGANPFLSKLPLIDLSFLDFMNALFGNYSLTIGALLISIFVGWVWGIHNAVQEVEQGNPQFRYRKVWSVTLRYVAPICIVIILIYIIVTGKFF
jgi:NSS family neurotransmitter:Na+ symporter